MAQRPIDGALAKLDWAHQHLTKLQSQLGPFEKRDDYLLVDETDPESGRHIQRARGLPRVDPSLPLIFSDFIHNTRAALDYAVYRPTGKGERLTYFPIYMLGRTTVRDKRSYANEGVQRIKHLPTPAKKFIESVQPYHRRRGRALAPLWQLQELSRAEKHHRIPLVIGRGQRLYSEIHASRAQELPEMVDSGFPYFDEGGIAAVIRSPLHPGIEFKPHVAMTVLVTEPGPAYGYGLGEVANAIYGDVAWILGALNRLL